MQISQVMTSYTRPNMKKDISASLYSLQKDCTNGAPQYELKSFVTMVVYWVPGLPNIKGISGHPQLSIFIFANGASCT